MVKVDTVAHSSNHNTQKAKARDYGKFEARVFHEYLTNRGYLERLCLNNNPQPKRKDYVITSEL